MKIILASKSSRRKNILSELGIPFEVMPSDIPEEQQGESPREIVEGLSLQKANDVATKVQGEALIIAADTLVADGRRILGKPKSEEEAAEMIRSLQNHTHQVYTGVTLRIVGEQAETMTFAESTEVTIRPMTEEEIQWYVKSGESMDKAGGYAIQGRFGIFVRNIAGDYYNVVGFPIASIYHKLKRNGIDLLELQK